MEHLLLGDSWIGSPSILPKMILLKCVKLSCLVTHRINITKCHKDGVVPKKMIILEVV